MSMVDDCIVIAKDILSGGIVIETLAVLLPQPLRIDHALKENAGAVLRVACALIERLLDGETGVETDARFHRDRSCSQYMCEGHHGGHHDLQIG